MGQRDTPSRLTARRTLQRRVWGDVLSGIVASHGQIFSMFFMKAVLLTYFGEVFLKYRNLPFLPQRVL